MTKLFTVIAATLFAVVAIATGAEAGFNVRLNAPAGFSEVHKAGCGGGGYGRSYRRVYQSVRRSKPRAQVASRHESKPAVVAKAEAEAPLQTAAVAPEETTSTAEIENSSITTDKQVAKVETPKVEKVAEKPAEKPAKKSDKKAEKKVASAGELGCKSFFPSVGMTLSVPCDKN